MKCEQFIFEAAYAAEFSAEELSRNAREHLPACASCRAAFRRLRNEPQFHEMEAAASISQRLHQSIDVVIAERAARFARISWGRMGLQVALSLLILVGSFAGLAFQSHSTAAAPMVSRR